MSLDGNLMSIESDIQNYNKVKDIVVNQICSEGYMTEEEKEEFLDRNQILVYKGNWFTKWFERNVSSVAKDKETYYMRIIQMKDKEINTHDTSIRNRKMRAGVYRNVFKRLLEKKYPEIMGKHEVDFSEVIFHSVENELLDNMTLIFKTHEMMSNYQETHKDFLKDANDIAVTLGFVNGTNLTIQD